MTLRYTNEAEVLPTATTVSQRVTGHNVRYAWAFSLAVIAIRPCGPLWGLTQLSCAAGFPARTGPLPEARVFGAPDKKARDRGRAFSAHHRRPTGMLARFNSRCVTITHVRTTNRSTFATHAAPAVDRSAGDRLGLCGRHPRALLAAADASVSQAPQSHRNERCE